MGNQAGSKDSTLWLLNSKSLFPIISLFGLLIYLGVSSGELGTRISENVVLFYMLLPVFFILYWNITIEDITKAVPKYRGHTGKVENFLKDRNNRPMSHNSLLIQLIYFLVFFGLIGTLMFFAELYTPIQADNIILPHALGTIAYHLILVVPAETIVFHGIIPLKIRMYFNNVNIPNWQKIGIRYGISQAIFSLSHIFVYGYSLSGLTWAFAWGIIFLAIAESFGLSATMGAHFGVNGVLSGALAHNGIRTGSLAIGSAGIMILISVILLSYPIFKTIKFISSKSMRNVNTRWFKWLQVKWVQKPNKQVK